jgi:hypothetical protein
MERSAAAMPRRLTQEERFLRWAQERENLLLPLLKTPLAEKVRAYKQLEKRLLKEARTSHEQQVISRSISMDLLRAASGSPWRVFSSYLKRVERLGYFSMFDRLEACVLAAESSRGSPTGERKTQALIMDIERRLRGRKLHPGIREEFDGGLARARRLMGLNAAKDEKR